MVNLTKEKLFDYFKKIASIPRPSYRTEKIMDFLRNYAQGNGYDVINNNNNLIITLPASPGFENKSPIILQGHADMIIGALIDKKIDLTKEPIPIQLDESGNFIISNGTTLGADNGISLIYFLNLMDSPEIPHPKLYLLITRDEEVGMLGAKSLNPKDIQDARYLINLDTEREGFITLGSSGYEIVNAVYNLKRENQFGSLWEINLSGISGGHSAGIGEITFSNAAKILSQVLCVLYNTHQISLVDFSCEAPSNVVPTAAKATFLTQADNEFFKNTIIKTFEEVISSLGISDPKVEAQVNLLQNNQQFEVLDSLSTVNSLFNILFSPNGLYQKEQGLSAESCNLFLVNLNREQLNLKIHLRFLNEKYYQNLKSLINIFFNFTGATFQFSDFSSSWEGNINSPIIKKTNELFEKYFNQPAKIIKSSGVLETSIFAKMLPKLEIISIGPNIYNAHNPRESLDINSAITMFNCLTELIKNLD